MQPKRILVGQVWHEGHSFNPVVTGREDFQFLRGDALLEQARTSQMAFSGVVLKADELGHTCIPVVGARARPGGPVAAEVFEEIVAEFEAAASKGGFDGICLELHGATIAERCADTEGLLLSRLRKAVGDAIPISVALDLHGYVTERMVRSATIMTGYRTQPHADMVETGERAMTLLDRLLRGEGRPRAMMTLIPFLTRGSDETWSEPMRTICAEADAWRGRGGLVDLSIFNIHPFVEAPSVGQVVLAYDDGSGIGTEASRAIAEALWEARDRFTETLPSVSAALAIARDSEEPIALGDQGDRVTGAGPGDSAEIARIALEEFPGLALATAVYDPEAVIAARAAGEGGILDRGIGGSITPSYTPLHRHWSVKSLGRARFVNKGPYMAGVEADFGDCAVLVSGAVSVVVTTLAPNVHDPAFYEAMGLPLSSRKAVVARAANHYKLSFQGLARPITVDTGGLTAFRPHEFPFVEARPIHPLDPVSWRFEDGFRLVSP